MKYLYPFAKIVLGVEAAVLIGAGFMLLVAGAVEGDSSFQLTAAFCLFLGVFGFIYAASIKPPKGGQHGGR